MIISFNSYINQASFYFLVIYIHIRRNIFHCSYKIQRVWGIGILILSIPIATAFIGYVLPLFWLIINIIKHIIEWSFCLIHINEASFYFLVIYIHIRWNIFHCSNKLQRIWGILILSIPIAVAFIGYVLPRGVLINH